MKVAMPVKPSKDKYLLSSAFGKSKFFLIYDLETDSYEIVENKELSGREAVNLISSKGAKIVITNHIGGGAYKLLTEIGLKAYFTQSKNKPFETVLQEYKEGKLKEITPANFMLIPQHHHHHGKHHHD
ncbi:NifB/NifX family molybdenum-iron cluster-binding protein [Sulfurihydrogenibium sp.]|uniref:NifB/NifX family molybdenum-iron cluster-binding protein n=1 Tax=Sulfurihydrogenibium sp. TaxID=2053621 RepID=UPI0026050DA0|nr:NifB/NifX family molybdenum-iron cluster-binding protein [Sulfurihydrogenibium sp.]